jgi:hypothetical protein
MRQTAGAAVIAIIGMLATATAVGAAYVKGVSSLYPFTTATINYRVEPSDGPAADERVWYGREAGGRYFRMEQYQEEDSGHREVVRVIEGNAEGTRVADYLAGTSYLGPILEPWQVIPYLNGDLPSALRGQIVDTERYLGRICNLLVATGTDVKYRIWLWGPVALKTEITPLRRGLGPTIVVRAVSIDVDELLPEEIRVYPRFEVIVPIPVPVIRTRPLYYPYPYRYPYREYRDERRHERREDRREERRRPGTVGPYQGK